MIRLNPHADWNRTHYQLIDTETRDYIGRCMIKYGTYNGNRVLELWSVLIFDKFQKQGYGTLMLKRIIKKYKKNELPLVLYVYKTNKIAIHLYEKLGFQIIGEYTEAYDPAWAMQYSK